MSEVKIAEDLRELYNAAKGVEGTGLWVPCGADRAIELIERVSAAESAVAEARAENARLRAPVSDEEWSTYDCAFDEHGLALDIEYVTRQNLDALIAARSQQPPTNTKE